MNETLNNGGANETEATTIFHNTEIVGVQDYTMTVDVWMGVWLAGDEGSTESAQIGVAGDGVRRNSLFEVTCGRMLQLCQPRQRALRLPQWRWS